MTINLILLILLVLSALAAIMRRSLLHAAIALAVTSVVLTILMFRLGAPLAAVFELSVCAGLITVIFMSTISLARPVLPEDVSAHAKDRLKRFWYLPVLLVIAGIALSRVVLPVLPLAAPAQEPSIREVLWNFRQIDVLGQVIVLLVGVFGIVVLFKDKPKSGSDI